MTDMSVAANPFIANPFIEHPSEHHEPHPTFGGEQWCFTFRNGYGASVIRHSISYGRESGQWEVAVLGPDGRLCYGTPVTDNVLGWQSEADAREVLRQIAELEGPASTHA